jgi:uncharacterized protein YndB with AHSA1/START domain
MARARGRTVRLPIFVHASSAKVFDAITNPDILTRWFMDRASFSPRRGGKYSFAWEGGPTHTGTVLDFAKGKGYTISWKWPGMETLPATKLKLTVERRAGGTILRFIHSGFLRGRPWDDLYEGAIRGWTYFMMNLKSVLETEHDLRSPYDW